MTNENTSSKKDELVEKGAIWEKKDKNGKTFLSIVLNDAKDQGLMAFSNDFKTEDKHPAWRIYGK